MPMEDKGPEAPRWPVISAIAVTLLMGLPLAMTAITLQGDQTSLAELRTEVLRSAASVRAEDDSSLSPTPRGVRVAHLRSDSEALLEMFRGRDYRIEMIRAGEVAVPRVQMASLPRDIAQMQSPDERKDLFLKAMLPLVLVANEEILSDRRRLEGLHAQRATGAALAPRDRQWLAELAQRYGLDAADELDTTLLLRRVDIVPASLTLAQAAEESGWGTSRFAQQGNALFGQLTWSAKHTGIAPRNRQAGESHRFRSFETLTASVRAYMHNLNTHRAYLDFRRNRASMRSAGAEPDGYKLAGFILDYSERGADYVAQLRRLIRANDLSDFDRAVLRNDADDLILYVAPSRGQTGQGAELLPASLTAPVAGGSADPADTAPVATEDGRY